MVQKSLLDLHQGASLPTAQAVSKKIKVMRKTGVFIESIITMISPVDSIQTQAAALLLFPLCLSALAMILTSLWFQIEGTWPIPLGLRESDKKEKKDSDYLANATEPLKEAFTKAKPQLPEQKQQAEIPKQQTEQAQEAQGVATPEIHSDHAMQSFVHEPLKLLQLGKEHSGGEIVVEALRLAGVARLFGIPGVQNLALYNAICSPPEVGTALEDGMAMHLIGNEEAAAYMAWGVWHKERRLGCACLIGGPGVTHALAGVACAFRDRTPLIVLTAGVRAGNERFQLHDVDNLSVLKPVCKALFRPASVEEIGPAIAEACRSSLEGRPGPVGIEIACDLYNKQGSFVWDDRNGGPIQVTDLEHLEPAPTQLTPAVQAELASDPMVNFLKFLTSEARKRKLDCTLVAEPGYCAQIAAVAWESSDKSWHFLCPGCGSRPSCYASENPGVAIPSSIGVARGQASHADGGVVISFQESSALMPQGLELSHSLGLPLLLLVPQVDALDTVLMAKSGLS